MSKIKTNQSTIQPYEAKTPMIEIKGGLLYHLFGSFPLNPASIA